jgi:hypothetical protein
MFAIDNEPRLEIYGSKNIVEGGINENIQKKILHC